MLGRVGFKGLCCVMFGLVGCLLVWFAVIWDVVFARLVLIGVALLWFVV